MKIRTGFVSNSSSSAFILHVRKETYDTMLLKMSPLEKSFCKSFFQKDNVFGIDTMCIEGQTGNYCFYESWSPENDEDQNELDEKFEGSAGTLWYDLEERFTKLPKTEYYTSSVDC